MFVCIHIFQRKIRIRCFQKHLFEANSISRDVHITMEASIALSCFYEKDTLWHTRSTPPKVQFAAWQYGNMLNTVSIKSLCVLPLCAPLRLLPSSPGYRLFTLATRSFYHITRVNAFAMWMFKYKFFHVRA